MQSRTLNIRNSSTVTRLNSRKIPSWEPNRVRLGNRDQIDDREGGGNGPGQAYSGHGRADLRLGCWPDLVPRPRPSIDHGDVGGPDRRKGRQTVDGRLALSGRRAILSARQRNKGVATCGVA